MNTPKKPRMSFDPEGEIRLSLIQVIVYIYDIITYPLYTLFYFPWNRRSRYKRIRGKAVSESDSEVVYECHNPKPNPPRDELILNNIDTMHKMFTYSILKFGNKRCLGTRKIVSEQQEKTPDGKLYTKLTLEDHYSWMSYTTVGRRARLFGNGLREIGVEAYDKIVLYADTKAEWLISAIGAFEHSISIVTIYTNLGPDGIIHGINQTKPEVAVTSIELLPKLLDVIDKIPTIKQIIYFENSVKPIPTNIPDRIKLHSFSDITDRGESSSVPRLPPRPEDPAIIMYTSGSTGVPKGVILSHRNIIAAFKSVTCVTVDGIGNVAPEDCYMAFLPLAHVLELLVESVMIFIGVPIGYSSPNTLTDKSTMIKAGDKGDATILKPAFMAVVPLILDRIYKGVQSNVKARGPFFVKFIDFCYKYRLSWVKRGYDTPLLNKLIFRKIKALIGGELRLMLCGGAPLPGDVHNFVRTCFTTNLIQGYGLTETCSTACIMDVDDLNPGRVGPPLPGCAIKLVNWDEGGYTVRDPAGHRGEIVIGGEFVAEGYYEMPELTEQEFYEDNGVRWFKTGDIGQINEDGTIQIIDRRKDLLKLQTGEYISLGKVESHLKIHPLIENICAYGDSLKAYIVALVLPDDRKLNELAASLSKPPGLTREQLCNDYDVTKNALQMIIDHAVTIGLQKTEIPQSIILVHDLWTPESGLVTAAFKLRRKPIFNRYQHYFNEMYGNKLPSISNIVKIV